MRASLLLLLGLTGCVAHWQQQAGPPVLVVNRSSATQFRVTRKDGSRVNVGAAPHRRADSLVGSLEPTAPWPERPGRIAIALSDIQSIAEREANLFAASVAIGTLVTVAVILLMFRGVGL